MHWYYIYLVPSIPCTYSPGKTWLFLSNGFYVNSILTFWFLENPMKSMNWTWTAKPVSMTSFSLLGCVGCKWSRFQMQIYNQKNKKNCICVSPTIRVFCFSHVFAVGSWWWIIWLNLIFNVIYTFGLHAQTQCIYMCHWRSLG